jgi:hypothetical protein
MPYLTKPLHKQDIVIELGHGCRRNIVRQVRQARRTGHTARTWGGSARYQWQGVITYNFKPLPVWGYTHNDDEYPPTEWANDTY